MAYEITAAELRELGEDSIAMVVVGNGTAIWLADRLEELERDKARLDFLDEANARLNAQYGTDYRWTLIMNHNVIRLMLGHLLVDLNDTDARGLPSCRDAIDRAVAEREAARRVAEVKAE